MTSILGKPEEAPTHVHNDSHDTQTCKKCTLPIYEGHAYELGDDRWHIDCFKCSKCDLSLGCNLNFLVLGNGNLICSNCLYSCKQCGKKIDDLAILTGDQAYCSNCFKCRSCKLKIEDLRYARTSKGLFCMECHEKLMARKKKYDEKKKEQREREKKEREREDQKERERQEQRDQIERQQKEQQERASQRSSYDLDSNSSFMNSYANNGSNMNSNTTLANSSFMGSSANLSNIAMGMSSQQTTQNGGGSANTLIYAHGNRSHTSVSSKNKNLPPPPPTSATTSSHRPTPSTSSGGSDHRPPVVPYLRYLTQSTKTSYSITSVGTSQFLTSEEESYGGTSYVSPALNVPDVPDPEFLIEEVVNYSDDETDGARRLLRPKVKVKARGEPRGSNSVSYVSPTSEYLTPNGHNTFVDEEEDELPSPTLIPVTPQKDGLAPAVDLDRVSSQHLTIESPTARHSFNKNILILSPNQFHDNVFHNASDGVNPSLRNDTLKVDNLSVEDQRRSPTSSPYAKNRQARVVETNDNISTDNLDDIPFAATPSRRAMAQGLTGVTSPPPRLALPSTPVKKTFSITTPGLIETKRLREEPKGLGLEGVSYDSNEIVRRHSRTYSAASDKKQKFEMYEAIKSGKIEMYESVKNPEAKEESFMGSAFGSISRKNKSILHKRSISGGSANGGIANKFNFFKKDERGHSRHVSEGSISGSGSINTSYMTPPMPSLSDEYANTVDLRNEISHLLSQRQALDSDVKRLTHEKQRQSELVRTLLQKIAVEQQTYETITRGIADLERNKKKLLDINQALSEQNHLLELALVGYMNDGVSTIKSNNLGVNPGTNLASNPVSAGSLIAGTPYSDLDENAETQKATRLKFWRRPKIGFSGVQYYSQGTPTLTPQTLTMPTQTSSLSLNLTKASQNYTSNAIQHPSSPKSGNGPMNGNGNSIQTSNNTNLNPKGIFTKSRSTNILDTFLTNDDVALHSSTIQKRANHEQTKVPLIISRCLQEVERRGLDLEGIYRISGGNSAIVSIENAFANAKDDKLMAKLEETLSGDINAVTSALKRYLRKLPDPLIPYAVYEEFIKVSSQNPPQGGIDKRITDLRAVIKKMPSANRYTLYMLCTHLALVSSFALANRMGFKNLSVVFAPTICRDETGQREMLDMGYRNDVTELLLMNSERIFVGLVD